MGGPAVPWRAGRVDGFAEKATPDGRLPDASQGGDHLRAVSILAKLSLLSSDTNSPRRSFIAWASMTKRLLHSLVHTL